MGNTGVSSDIDFRNKNRGNVSLVLGILSIITSFVGVGFVLGIIGLIYGVID